MRRFHCLFKKGTLRLFNEILLSLRVTVRCWRKKIACSWLPRICSIWPEGVGPITTSILICVTRPSKGDWSSYKAIAGSSEFSVLLGYCCEIAHKRGGFLAFLDNYYFVSDPALSPNVRGLVSPTNVWPLTLESSRGEKTISSRQCQHYNCPLFNYYIGVGDLNFVLGRC